jgi:hypothetical protein
MWRLWSLLRGRVLVTALKAALASGLAFWLGSLLPEPLDGYKYYAALGAFTVVGLAVADSVKESLQVAGAVAVGVVIALVVQALSFANPFTVAVVIAAGVLLGASRIFGVQRTWAPLAALFVLATGGPDPEPMAWGYVAQVPLGAVIGLVVNAIFLAPVGDEDLDLSARQVRHLLADQMRSYAEVLEDQARTGDDVEAADRRNEMVHENIVALEEAQARLRTAISDARRARRGNPRTRLAPDRYRRDLSRAEATSRCSATLLAVGVVLGQSALPLSDHGVVLRQHSATALDQAAQVFDDPQAAREEPQLITTIGESIEAMLEQARSMSEEEGLDHVLFGALALAVQDCVRIFTREVADVPGP